jgi:hypothetical protein
LRARIAELEFRLERAAQKRQTPAAPALDGPPEQQPQEMERRGGRRNRPDARMVILDGEHLCLTEAARRLCISPSALHFRIVNRTGGDAGYSDVDLRTIGADRVHGTSRGAQEDGSTR